jgi:hypothetical protein
MATMNQIGLGLSGSTGTGNFVGANTPTLITPVLGAATATSINFGGSTLSSYIATTAWTPVVTFATPGDLSVNYAIQTGNYSKIGSIVNISGRLGFTPTYTTASGNLNITGAPYSSVINNSFGPVLMQNVILSVGYTSVLAALSGNIIAFIQYSSAQFASGLSTPQIVSGVTYYFDFTITYNI